MIIPLSIGAIATPQLLSQKGCYGEFGGHFMPLMFHETLEAVTVAYQAIGALDVERQYPNVFWMRKFGVEDIPVLTGTQKLKDAMNEVLRDWSTYMDTTHHVLGTACGPHSFPEMTAWFQSVIGLEARSQILQQTGTLPTEVYACVGGGSNAMGIFSEFLEDAAVQLVEAEAGELGINTPHHASRLAASNASLSIAQGYKTYLLSRTGSTVQPGDEMLSIVPNGETLILEAKVQNQDIGFVRAGMRVKVKLATFPYQKFGMFEGTVSKVSPNAVNEQNGELVFPVQVQLQQQSVKTHDQEVLLSRGMTATAEIVTRQTTVMSFLLAPITASWDRALSVR